MGALPKVLAECGDDVRVIIPKYKGIKKEFISEMKFLGSFGVNVGWRRQHCGVFEIIKNNVTYYFVDNEYYFKRDGLYGYYDDGERFGYFDRAVLEVLRFVKWCPDVLHCNDWQCAMIPALHKLEYQHHSDGFYAKMKTVISIHNLLFQGNYDKNILSELFGYTLEQYENGTVELYGAASFMKAGLVYADKISTVSNTYAQEIKTDWYGENLDGVLRERSDDVWGIVNGID